MGTSGEPDQRGNRKLACSLQVREWGCELFVTDPGIHTGHADAVVDVFALRGLHGGDCTRRITWPLMQRLPWPTSLTRVPLRPLVARTATKLTAPSARRRTPGSRSCAPRPGAGGHACSCSTPPPCKTTRPSSSPPRSRARARSCRTC